MGRPKKTRRICKVPNNITFEPNIKNDSPPIILFMDEYETIRLIDLEGLDQEECAKRMNVARTTAQLIYNNARKKMADALVNARKVIVSGGDVTQCILKGKCSNCNIDIINDYIKPPKKEIGHKRIAIPTNNGKIFSHFGRAEYFRIYDILDNKIINQYTFNPNKNAHKALINILQDIETDVIICFGMGHIIQELVKIKNIQLFTGVFGEEKNAIESYLSGTLESKEVECALIDLMKD